MNIISREEIFKESLLNVEEGQLVLELLKLGESYGFEGCIDKFSLAVQAYVQELVKEREYVKFEHRYIYIMNVCFVVELYLRGYYNKEHYMGYEEFLNIVNEGKTSELLISVHDVFTLHIHRLKKAISKSKKALRGSLYFQDTQKLLTELDKDLSICARYPITSANLSEFYFGRYYGNCGTVLVERLVGFIQLEKEVYSLYNELHIMSKFNLQNINRILSSYIKTIGNQLPFNLFEKVINNYLFATIYSDSPEDLTISSVDAKLLITEIKMGTLNSDEIIDKFIDKFEFVGFRAKHLKEYGKYLDKKIKNLKEYSFFDELFLVAPPE